MRIHFRICISWIKKKKVYGAQTDTLRTHIRH